jgi:hypothetical protein
MSLKYIRFLRAWVCAVVLLACLAVALADVPAERENANNRAKPAANGKLPTLDEFSRDIMDKHSAKKNKSGMEPKAGGEQKEAGSGDVSAHTTNGELNGAKAATPPLPPAPSAGDPASLEPEEQGNEVNEGDVGSGVGAASPDAHTHTHAHTRAPAELPGSTVSSSPSTATSTSSDAPVPAPAPEGEPAAGGERESDGVVGGSDDVIPPDTLTTHTRERIQGSAVTPGSAAGGSVDAETVEKSGKGTQTHTHSSSYERGRERERERESERSAHSNSHTDAATPPTSTNAAPEPTPTPYMAPSVEGVAAVASQVV